MVSDHTHEIQQGTHNTTHPLSAGAPPIWRPPIIWTCRKNRMPLQLPLLLRQLYRPPRWRLDQAIMYFNPSKLLLQLQLLHAAGAGTASGASLADTALAQQPAAELLPAARNSSAAGESTRNDYHTPFMTRPPGRECGRVIALHGYRTLLMAPTT